MAQRTPIETWLPALDATAGRSASSHTSSTSLSKTPERRVMATIAE
jgi:hypothetical protein